MSLIGQAMGSWQKHGRVIGGVTLSLLGSFVLYALYVESTRKKINKKSKKDKDVVGPDSPNARLTGNRRRLSSEGHDDMSRSPSFSKSPSFYELSKDDSGPSNTVPAWTALGLEQPLVIAMVGLPARGKSYLVKMIMRYLKWTGFETKVFNVGSYRRQVGLASADSHFFDNSNPDAQKIREKLAMAVQDSMYTWLHETEAIVEGAVGGAAEGLAGDVGLNGVGGVSTGAGAAGVGSVKRRIAIFDATNTTQSRRLALMQRASKENVFLLFVESICDDEEVLQRNYELKLQNEDYKNMDPAAARRDFMERVREYEKVYETITDDEDGGNISYIKLVNVGQKVITRHCHGYLPSQVAFYLQNVHIQPRKIYLTINSEPLESLQGVDSRLGGKESGQLTEAGRLFSRQLVSYLKYEQEHDLVGTGKDFIVMTGTGKLHYESVLYMKGNNFKVFHTPLLNELRGGDLHGLSKDEMRLLYPAEYDKRVNDKLNYRYPGVGGESYLDVIERVRPVIIELERQRRSIVIVCHLAVLRCIYAYFMGVPLQEIPIKEFDRHKVYELSPGPFGCSCAVVEPNLLTHDEADVQLREPRGV